MEGADVERQTGHKADLFAGKAVETAAEVKWKVSKSKPAATEGTDCRDTAANYLQSLRVSNDSIDKTIPFFLRCVQC